MIEATIIDRTNRTFFEPVIPEPLKDCGMAVGAIMDGAAVGVLLIDADDADSSLFWLRFIYVIRGKRRQGAGRAMLRFFEGLIKGPTKVNITLECLFSEEMPGPKGFFEAVGFVKDSADYPVISFSMSMVSETMMDRCCGSSLKGRQGSAEQLTVRPLSSVTAVEWRQLLDNLEADGNAISIPRDLCDKEVSQVLFAGGRASGCILYISLPGGYLLRYLGNTASPRQQSIRRLIYASYHALQETAPDALIYLCEERDGTQQLVEKLLEKKPQTIGYSRLYMKVV